MITFESDQFPTSHVRVIPHGAPDQLDVWFHEHLEEPTEEEMDIAYGEWAELIFDPDCDPPF